MPRKKQEKGKLTSKEASVLDMPERMKAEEIESLVVELAKQNNSPAKIGQILKEKHGVHKISVLGKKITRILSDHKVQYPNDSHFINKKIENIKSHYAKNKQDKKAEREIVRYLSLKKKLENYSL
ncbi:hypothetical protein J4466_01985 [Candidatus Pacearchaeota archaeon]|nr:hypothetical protein [Candidatus Pacearchaeota archaeon]